MNVRLYGSRLVWLAMLFLAVVLYGSFQAGLTTNLSIEKTTYPFEGLEDLYSKTEFRIGGVAQTTNEDIFRVSRVLNNLKNPVPFYFTHGRLSEILSRT